MPLRETLRSILPHCVDLVAPCLLCSLSLATSAPPLRPLVEQMHSYSSLSAVGRRYLWLVIAACVGAGACGGADSSGRDANSADDITYVSGFFAPERDGTLPEWRWMGPEGLMQLKNTRRNMVLKLRLAAPRGVEGFPAVTLTFNGNLLDQVTDSSDFGREYKIAADRQSAGERSELVIRTDRTIVPKERGASNDERRLGLSVSQASWLPQ